jgi:HPt (histidine-containing phosphotransfer) domain-containing protein
LASFYESARRLLDETHHALTQDLQSAVHRAAHTLKSTGAAVGAVRLAAVAKVLEDTTRETLP